MATGLETNGRGQTGPETVRRFFNLNAGNKSALSDFFYTREFLQISQCRAQASNFRLQSFQDMFFLEDFEARLRCCASERISRIAVPVGESFTIGYGSI